MNLKIGQNKEAFIFKIRNSPKKRKKSASDYQNLNNTNNHFQRSSIQP